ncbi:TIR domain-containing protein [uncultured Lamprocystis sp.]|jgi:predicted nucleotide-binding protein|uniref:TIR domain-containing protein n=1 Tax=uncultured Lamprocystis sp. TaxID=543132 RepID=UPI0025D45A7D|nr:TIR domain-containing protein [uncultured Lamprocystis sp.]
MAIEFHDGIDALRGLIGASGIKGEWSDDGIGKHTFKSQRKGVLNYWPHKGTIQCQGKGEPKAELEQILSASVPISSSAIVSTPKDEKTKIFVVHGHDTRALEQLELVLRRLGLDPYILQNNDGESKTLIEALEQQIYKEAAFGIVLLTPDDYGYPKSKTDQDRQPRARQNVILELGMVLASLGRERMVLLKKGALEIPTDVNGVIYLEFNDHVKEVAVKLATRMKGAGIKISDALIHSAAA